MPRYIDIDALKKDIRENYVVYGYADFISDFFRCLDEQSTVDAEELITKHEDIGYEKGYRDGYAEALEVTDNTEPVRHGHWINDFSSPLKCSSCGIVSKANEITLRTDFKFCPYCGAKMDETCN